MTDNQQAARLLALWKSGRDKFSSFFAVLEEVRQEVGDDDLARWCREELLIGISAIVKMQEVMKKADADVFGLHLLVPPKARGVSERLNAPNALKNSPR